MSASAGFSSVMRVTQISGPGPSGALVLQSMHSETYVYILWSQDACRFTPLINTPGPGVHV